MKAKALENFRAAVLALNATPACPNAATSRAYYAAYQACWNMFEENGYRPPDRSIGGGAYWKHSTIRENLVKFVILDEDEADLVENLREMRVIADYGLEDIDSTDAGNLLDDARTILAKAGISG